MAEWTPLSFSFILPNPPISWQIMLAFVNVHPGGVQAGDEAWAQLPAVKEFALQ